MNQRYIITDPRPLDCFKDKTFSDFKKLDVYKALYSSIETGKVENACHWITECIISGYCIEIMEKLILFGAKIIHINSPNLPEYLWNRYDGFRNSYNHINQKQKKELIHLRNTQNVRNCLFDIVVTLALAPKTKRYDKYPKVKEEEFSFQNIKDKMNATMQLLPSHIIKFTDPEELRVIMNEFFFNLKNENGGYEKASYWIAWLVQWEKYNKKRKQSFEIEERPIKGLKKQLCRDIIWLVWSVIFEEANIRDIKIKRQIQSLFLLYKDNFTSGKRNTRLPLVYNAIGYLTLPVKFNVSLRPNLDIFIKTQCNINKIFEDKKKSEVQSYTEPPKPQKKIVGAEKEISIAKLDRIKEIDEIFFNQ